VRLYELATFYSLLRICTNWSWNSVGISTQWTLM